VSFRESLEQALSEPASAFSLTVTHPNHISPESSREGGLVLERDTTGMERNDRSTFDIDHEMVEMAKNSGRFTILSGILTKRYQQMREVLRMQ
jgi:flagellar basal-body rod protein FlgB